MTDTAEAYRKIASLRPDQPIKSGAVWTVILHPDKTFADEITNADLLWIKCPKSKSVATLFRAYKQNTPGIEGNVQFVQHHVLLKESALVGKLRIVDDLTLIEAVKEKDVQSRLSGAYDVRKSAPLQEMTPHAVNKTDGGTSRSEKSSSKIPVLAAIDQTTKSGAQISQPILPELKGKAVSVTEPPVLEARVELNEQQGWRDFFYERQEYLGRMMKRTSVVDCTAIDRNIYLEWTNLTPAQRQYFGNRAKSISHRSSDDHKGFWAYYYHQLEVEQDQGSQPHGSFKAMEQTFHRFVGAWNLLGLEERDSWFDLVDPVLSYRLAPPPPATSLLSGQTPSDGNAQPLLLSDLSHGQSTHPRPAPPPVNSLAKKEEAGSASADPLAQSGKMLDKNETRPARFNIDELLEGLSVEQLEAGVAKGIEIITSIKHEFDAVPSSDSDQWLKNITSVEKQATRTQTIVGVVGATGAGKSSVINALLDEERLVPTNCMRACTAVVTEISYNQTDIPYRAEIEFIGQDDWRKELEISLDDLIDGNGEVSRECINEESEAGIAYAKIRAVYPLLTKEEMKNTTVERLMDHSNVKLLGEKHVIDDDDSSAFYKKLQVYVDSKEKAFSREKKTEAEKARAKQMEYWPLIKVVRLYVRAPALATGAVIVDLPGVHDSNQARAAVAQGYLKQCTGLWIVAPINRAVDDKSAKTLLGDTFKRQLKMDGAYNSVTFICSKTDDISLTEAQDSLGLDQEVAPLYAKSEELRRSKEKLQDEVKELKNTRSDIDATIDGADDQLEIWEKLLESVEDGETVYAPREEDHDKKRKRSDGSTEPRKKSKYVEDSDDDFVADNESEHSEGERAEQEAAADDEVRGEPLTQDSINEKIDELKSTKKQGRRERSQIDQTMKEIRSKISDIDEEQDEIDAELSEKCIKGRNEYSRKAIQQDFASGIRELDQEIAEEEDAANFNPDVDARDYDEVAKSLPVFCVSSRGYQRLMGRMKKDKGLNAFQNTNDTEMPALQAHCTELTVTNREVSCKRFLNSLSQLLNSLRLWSSSDGSSMNLTEGQLKREAELLNEKLRKLDTALENAAKSSCAFIKTELQDCLYRLFSQAVISGKLQANDIQARWGAPYNRFNRAEGGLHYSTYKATVRRQGVYTGSTGSNNFNENLIEPLIKQIASGWEKAFARRIPQVLVTLSPKTNQLVTAFHDEVEQRALRNGSNIVSFQMLKQQIPTYMATVRDASNAARELINTKQKDINREFVPVIMAAMTPAYDETTAEFGTGSYKRMKESMTRHVDRVKDTMFQQSVDRVRDLLRVMVGEAEDTLLDSLDLVWQSVKRDYCSVVIGSDNKSGHSQQLTKQQRMIRTRISTIVENVESTVREIVGLESLEQGEVIKDDPVEDDIAAETVDHTEVENASGSVIRSSSEHLPEAETSITLPPSRSEVPSLTDEDSESEFSRDSSCYPPGGEMSMTPSSEGESDGSY